MKPACVVMRPNACALIWLLSIPLNFGEFVRLMNSKRTSPDWLPANRVCFASTRSTFLRNWYRASPSVRGALPYTPAPGFVNAFAAKKRASGCSADDTRSSSLPDVFGSPTRFGRWRPRKRPRFASDTPALNTELSGAPLTSSTTADAVQPPSRRYLALPLLAGEGI